MFSIREFYPDEIIDSVYTFDWGRMVGKYKGIVFDIDNTLVAHGAPAEERTAELFELLHSLGFRTLLASNNKEERVAPFAEYIHTDYVHKAGKPKPKGYRRVLEKLGFAREEILFVGDQIFTDIWGANMAGMGTMLTAPVDPSTDEIQIVVKRWMEWPFRKVRNKK